MDLLSQGKECTQSVVDKTFELVDALRDSKMRDDDSSTASMIHALAEEIKIQLSQLGTLCQKLESKNSNLGDEMISNGVGETRSELLAHRDSLREQIEKENAFLKCLIDSTRDLVGAIDRTWPRK